MSEKTAKAERKRQQAREMVRRTMVSIGEQLGRVAEQSGGRVGAVLLMTDMEGVAIAGCFHTETPEQGEAMTRKIVMAAARRVGGGAVFATTVSGDDAMAHVMRVVPDLEPEGES